MRKTLASSSVQTEILTLMVMFSCNQHRSHVTAAQCRSCQSVELISFCKTFFPISSDLKREKPHWESVLISLPLRGSYLEFSCFHNISDAVHFLMHISGSNAGMDKLRCVGHMRSLKLFYSCLPNLKKLS